MVLGAVVRPELLLLEELLLGGLDVGVVLDVDVRRGVGRALVLRRLDRGGLLGDLGLSRRGLLGGLLLDAAMKDPAWESRLNDLMNRISRDQDRKAFEGWTFKGGPADA